MQTARRRLGDVRCQNARATRPGDAGARLAARPQVALRLLTGGVVERWLGVQLVMRPLSIGGCTEALTRAGLPASHPDLSVLATRLHERTGGHPFLVTATARDTVRMGEESAVTGSAVEFVRTLRDGLATSARRVLDRAVVDGPEFDLFSVASAARMRLDEVVGVLEELLLVGLVVDSGKVMVAPGFHDLLLSAIGPGRPTLHLELATALSDRGRAHAERALGHLLAARGLADAAVLARTAEIASGVAAENGVSSAASNSTAWRSRPAGPQGCPSRSRTGRWLGSRCAIGPASSPPVLPRRPSWRRGRR